MSKLLSSYSKIGFTILPHKLNTDDMQHLQIMGKHVVGYVTYNKADSEYKFTAESAGSAEWALDIVKKLPYCETTDTWIIFDCPPHATKVAFQHILLGEKIEIDKWDTWSVGGTDAEVAVITSWSVA